MHGVCSRSASSYCTPFVVAHWHPSEDWHHFQSGTARAGRRAISDRDRGTGEVIWLFSSRTVPGARERRFSTSMLARLVFATCKLLEEPAGGARNAMPGAMLTGTRGAVGSFLPVASSAIWVECESGRVRSPVESGVLVGKWDNYAGVKQDEQSSSQVTV